MTWSLGIGYVLPPPASVSARVIYARYNVNYSLFKVDLIAAVKHVLSVCGFMPMTMKQPNTFEWEIAKTANMLTIGCRRQLSRQKLQRERIQLGLLSVPKKITGERN